MLDCVIRRGDQYVQEFDGDRMILTSHLDQAYMFSTEARAQVFLSSLVPDDDRGQYVIEARS